MNRRKLIKLSAFVATGTAMTGLLPGCKSDTIAIDIDGYTPGFLSNQQYAFIRDLADSLLPETDTPGALSVGLPQIYDSILNNILTSEQKSEQSEKLSTLMNAIQENNNGSSLTDIAESERLDFVRQLDSKFLQSQDEVSTTYKQVKQGLIQYYLKTEEVGTTLLSYLPVPGEYQACITVEEAGGKAWAL